METGTPTAGTAAPTDRPCEHLDVRSLAPPEPLVRTLEMLAELPDGTLLVQRNDRRPRFLYPKLEERGYRYETVDRDGDVLTFVWRECPG